VSNRVRDRVLPWQVCAVISHQVEAARAVGKREAGGAAAATDAVDTRDDLKRNISFGRPPTLLLVGEHSWVTGFQAHYRFSLPCIQNHEAVDLRLGDGVASTTFAHANYLRLR